MFAFMVMNPLANSKTAAKRPKNGKEYPTLPVTFVITFVVAASLIIIVSSVVTTAP
jgi:hypothetical protein